MWKDANRPHRDNRVRRHVCPARRDVADHRALLDGRERERGNGVARVQQRREQIDLGWNPIPTQRWPKTWPPKSLRVDVSNRLVIVGLLLPNDHPLILAPHALLAAPRARQCRWLAGFPNEALTDDTPVVS